MPKKVSILIPVIRPEVVKKCLESIKLNAGIPEEEYEIITEFDKDKIGCSRMLKELVKRSNSSRVMFIGEDVIVGKDFLKEALLALDNMPDGLGLVALNDGDALGGEGQKREHKLASHWLTDKRMLLLLDGEFFNTDYYHSYCDNELTARCVELNKFAFAEKSIIKHNVIKDSIYRETRRSFKKKFDKKLYFYRKEHQWKTGLQHTGERCIPEFMKKSLGIYQEHLTRYTFALPYALDKNVLDVACGSGYGTNLLYDVAKEIMGIDKDINSLVYAKRHYRGNFGPYNLNKAFPEQNFDLVVSFETIEHLERAEFFIKNVSLYSKAFLFSVPINNANQFHVKVYKDIFDIEPLILKYFKKVDWWSQSGIEIRRGIQKSKYLIGYATNL